MGNEKEQALVFNGQEENVSTLSYDDLLSRIINLVKASVKTSDKIDFVIKSPKWQLYAFLIAVIALISIAIAIIIAKVINGFDNGAFIGLLCILGIFLILVLFGIYVYIKVELRLENGVYTYRGIFKTRSCNAKDIKEGMVETAPGGIKVIFIGKDNQPLLQYRDIVRTFKSGQLKRSLNYYNIPLRTYLYL